jgi:hypothetical protein
VIEKREAVTGGWSVELLMTGMRAQKSWECTDGNVSKRKETASESIRRRGAAIMRLCF